MKKTRFVSVLTAAAIFLTALFIPGCSCGGRVSPSDKPETTQTTIATEPSEPDIPEETTATSPTEITTTTTEETTTTTLTTTATTASTTAKKDGESSAIAKPNHKTKYYIVVYTGSQSTVVYGKDENGKYTKTVKVFSCSTGAKSSPTKTGQYSIKKKYRWRYLVGSVYGQYCSSIGNNYLFHTAPYKKKKVNSLDNAEYDKLGTAASHGCIRLTTADCKWIYDNCEIGTQVNVVKSSGPAGPGIPKRNPDKKYSGWDPTDKWASGNPYFAESSTSSSSSTTTTKSTTESTTSSTSKPETPPAEPEKPTEPEKPEPPENSEE